jgi:uroporphyrinogen decarboxylase
MATAIPQDTMTPLERLGAFVQGKPYDRIPFNAFMGDHAAQVINAKVSDLAYSSSLMAKAQIAAYQHYKLDAVGVAPGHLAVAEALGTELEFPENGTAYVKKFALDNVADFKHLEIPDPRKAGRFPLFLEAIEILNEKVGLEVPVGFLFGGPMSTAYSLVGADKLLRALRTDPELVHALLDFCVESAIPLIREVAKLNVGFAIVDPVSSGSVISYEMFRKFSKPALTKLIARVKEVSAPPLLHICGNTRKIIADMADTGAGVLSLDNMIDLADAKRTVGDRITLVGNIRPVDTMLLGTTETVEENVKECLRKGYDSPRGYILALGCALPIETPPANVHALSQAVRRYGQFPYRPELFGAAIN